MVEKLIAIHSARLFSRHFAFMSISRILLAASKTQVHLGKLCRVNHSWGRRIFLRVLSDVGVDGGTYTVWAC